MNKILNSAKQKQIVSNINKMLETIKFLISVFILFWKGWCQKLIIKFIRLKALYRCKN